MNILIVSQCDKRGLTETRRIVDQFAERRGDRTWQTPITLDGLDTLRRLLRKTARKNTSVACHWIRGIGHTELLWVVGDHSRFNDLGAVPTNSTERDVLRRHDENDWHSGELIGLLTDVGSLLHDIGKAIAAFQQRLRGELSGKNLIRHEWVSLRLFEAFVGDDDDATWLRRLISPTAADDARWLKNLKKDGIDDALPSPFASLARAPLAQAIGWLVATHHRLPQLPDRGSQFQMSMLRGVLGQMRPEWNEPAIFDAPDRNAFKPFWSFPDGLPVINNEWRKRAARIAKRLLARVMENSLGDVLGNPYVMHLSRLSLMLADHHYSRIEEDGDPERVKVKTDGKLLANTKKDRTPNQTLDEHLIGVARHGAEVARFLPRFEQFLPRLGKHRLLRQRTKDERFRWQNKAAELATGMRERSQQHGAFIVNMASTGCGKTLANARVMYALADPHSGMRCAFAMGLRTLTLQTGRAFRDLLDLGDEELAIRVGGSASKKLFEHYEEKAENSGSASRQDLLDENTHVLFEGQQDDHPLLRRAVADPQVRALLVAPILVCTIDHLTPATESQRGGRQIAPMLRLMSGDLVLDEPDDFDLADLPALTRLVHWAGLLGARVLLSSATLPPALIQGLFEAYRNGRQHFQRNRGERPGAADQTPDICCAWIDEFGHLQADCAEPTSFAAKHDEFVIKRHKQLAKAEVRRRYAVLPLDLTGLNQQQRVVRFAELVRDNAVLLHARHHSVDPRSGKRVSFGLVRMANIEPLVDIALALYKQGAPAGVRIHLCVYHSQFPLLIRSAIERQLDQALNRRWPHRDQAEPVFQLADIRQRLDRHDEADHLFIVLGSPVTEVGRDHDYDWAIAEPSSMRSLIQLSGRLRRHREGECTSANLLIFDTNLRHFKDAGKPAFCKPGFESKDFPLENHFMKELLSDLEGDVIDARPRIVSKPLEQLQPSKRLVDLEHARMRREMLVQTFVTPVIPGARQRGSAQAGPVPVRNAASWWHLPPADALLTAVLQQQSPFRLDVIPRVDLLLRPKEDEDDYELVLMMDKPGKYGQPIEVKVEQSRNHRIADAQVEGDGIAPWGQIDYMEALTLLAAELDMGLDKCARSFGTVTLADNEQGWRFHPVLGFTKAKI